MDPKGCAPKGQLPVPLGSTPSLAPRAPRSRTSI